MIPEDVFNKQWRKDEDGTRYKICPNCQKKLVFTGIQDDLIHNMLMRNSLD